MGTRARRFIPNTSALVAWGQKPTTRHLSITDKRPHIKQYFKFKALLKAHMNKFSAHRIQTNEFIEILHPWHIHPLQGGLRQELPHSSSRACDAPSPAVAHPSPASRRSAYPSVPLHGQGPFGHLQCRQSA